jgi:hypothetical protein
MLNGERDLFQPRADGQLSREEVDGIDPMNFQLSILVRLRHFYPDLAGRLPGITQQIPSNDIFISFDPTRHSVP